MSSDVDARAQATLEAFRERARRVLSSSVAKRMDLDDLGVRWDLTFTHARGEPTSTTEVSRTLPDEEQIEAAAARMRPLLLQGELVYYDNVTRALGRVAMNAPNSIRRQIAELAKP